MTEKRNRKRQLRIYIYVTQEELDDIRSKAKAAGLSVGEYGRRIMSVHKVGAAPTEEEHEIVWELRRIESNLDQILQRMNVLGIIPSSSLTKCIDDLQELGHNIETTLINRNARIRT